MALVFTHIEKTAGTSFRVYLLKMFDQSTFFWFRDSKENFPDRDFFLIGGHRRAFEFDRSISDSILLSIVREPVSRIRSLHRYISKQIIGRRADPLRDPYCLQGFDLTSIRNSLSNSEDFRTRSYNAQSLNFCSDGATPSSPDLAAEALEYLHSRPVMIGLQHDIGRFVLQLVRHWGFGTNFPTENTSREIEGILDPFGGDDERAIREVCDQDILLYQSLREQGGLFNVTADRARRERVPVPLRSDYFAKISISRVGAEACLVGQAGETLEIAVRILNLGACTFAGRRGCQPNLSYHVYDLAGNIVEYDGLRTKFLGALLPYAEELHVAKLRFPSEKGRYLVEPALVIENVSWIDRERDADTERFEILVV